jgi:predicted metal-dependent phosphoesterase TrpH
MKLLKVEFHCHTCFSKDSLTRPKALVDAARRKGIDRLIITDHNSIGGALEAKKLDPELVIIGEEIMTTQGELLTAFVTEEIPKGLEPLEAIRRLKEQGAFISVSHPFDARRGWKNFESFMEIVPLVDAIETFNARCVEGRDNVKAKEFARQHNLAGTVGSDAHAPLELGRATLTVEEFADAEGLRSVIRSGVEDVRLSSIFIHFISRYATMMKMLGYGNGPISSRSD